MSIPRPHRNTCNVPIDPQAADLLAALSRIAKRPRSRIVSLLLRDALHRYEGVLFAAEARQ